MNLPQAGGCLCGKIRYDITETPQLVYTCHCTACQHQMSSAFSLGVAVPDPVGAQFPHEAAEFENVPEGAARLPLIDYRQFQRPLRVPELHAPTSS